MTLSRLFWLILGVLVTLFLIPVLLIGGLLLLSLCLLLSIWLPIAIIIFGALLIAIGVTLLLIPK
jgi:hypothetical protein